MKKINSRGKSRNLLTTILVMAAAVFGFASCEKYDLEETTPEWLGASIYDYLADNGYDTYVQIIDALGYKMSCQGRVVRLFSSLMKKPYSVSLTQAFSKKPMANLLLPSRTCPWLRRRCCSTAQC